jgi:hypothetical protein
MWGAFSLTRGRIYRLQLLLVFASTVILWSGSRGARDHILLSQIRYFPFCRLLQLEGLRWRYSTPPPHGMTWSESEPESELFYDWRFTANQSILAPSPLRLTARIFFQLNTCCNSPYVTTLWREDGFFSYEYAWPYSMLLNFFILHYKQHYTTSHVVWDESLKAGSRLYMSCSCLLSSQKHLHQMLWLWEAYEL